MSEKPIYPEKKANSLLLTALAFVLLLLAACLTTGLAVAPRGRDFAVGDVAESTILAPRDIEDTAATDRLKDVAAADVEPVYYLDLAAVNRMQSELYGFLDSLDIAVRKARGILAERIEADPENPALQGELTREAWSGVLLVDMESLLGSVDGLQRDMLLDILVMSEQDYADWAAAWRETYAAELVETLRSGVDESSVSSVRTTYAAKLNERSDESLAPFNTYVAQRFIIGTRTIDSALTKNAMERARSEIPTVIIAEGAPIVTKGQTFDEARLALMQKAGLLIDQQSYTRRYVACSLIALLFVVAFGAFLLTRRRKIADLPKAITITTLVMAVALVGEFFTTMVAPDFNTVFLAVSLIAFLVSIEVAAAAALMLSPLFGLIAAGSSLDFAVFATVMVQTALGGIFGAFALRSAHNRGGVFFAGGICAVGLALGVTAFDVLLGAPFLRQMLPGVLWAFGSCAIFAVVSVGLMPVFESLFDIVTPSRLTELSNANHPVLQRLMLEAPGTYHHSIMTASLAEAAANAIGANSQLARVGAYYHDIGKLRRPYFFKENQREGDNPHDALDARQSAAILLAHTKDGVQLGQKYKLPGEVQRMILEHHGTTLTAYFYHKAKEQAGGEELSEAEFRYSGPKPQTKEAAILMLADSVEAAVRSLKNPTPETVDDTTRKIIKGKIDDGQLSSASLTLQEVETIARTMIKAFGGLLHERIEYPDMDTAKDETPALETSSDEPDRDTGK